MNNLIGAILFIFLGRIIYNLLLLLALPFLFMRLWHRGRKAPAYRKRWLERLGFFAVPAKQGGIWIHAVSVGEFMAALPFIRALRQQYPEEPITVTTTTPTGSGRVTTELGDSVFHVYLPYDFNFAVQSFLAKVQPKISIILETELWLNLLYACKQRDIPVFIINARLSPRSFQRYMWIRSIVRYMLNTTTQVMAQSQADADRFLQLGLTENKLSVPGNIKYDIKVTEQQEHKLQKTQWQRLVWIAASTHEGEEQQILHVFAKLRQQIPRLLLIIVPRHPERFNVVAALITAQGFSLARRSLQQPCEPSTDVFLVDTMGELGIFYQIADVAFVGGSLVPVGGHNILEAAAVGVPVLTGPILHNFVEISQQMLAANAMVVVNNSEELATILLTWLQNEQIRKTIGANGKALVVKHQGATKKILDVVADAMMRKV